LMGQNYKNYVPLPQIPQKSTNDDFCGMLSTKFHTLLKMTLFIKY